MNSAAQPASSVIEAICRSFVMVRQLCSSAPSPTVGGARSRCSLRLASASPL